MRAQFVNENINFKRKGNSKKSLGVGIAVQNRNSNKRLKNFKEMNPEVNVAYNSGSHLSAPNGPHPDWQVINISLTNSPYSLEDNKAKYLKWVENNTDFDIIEAGDGYERSYRPNGDPDRDERHDQGIAIRMRNEEDVS